MIIIVGFIATAIYFLLMVVTDPLAHDERKFKIMKNIKRLEEIDKEIVQLQKERDVIEHSIQRES